MLHLVASVRVATWLCKLSMEMSVFLANFCLVIIVFNMQGLKVGACFALSSFLCSSSSVLDNLTNSDIPIFLTTGKAVIMPNKQICLLLGTEDSLVHHDWVESTKSRLEEKKVSVEFRLVQGLEHEIAKGQIGELMGWLDKQV